MKKAKVVIGMNYGDEGKGHITNYLSDDKTLNIRFNGGAQAAHAVHLSDGREHIFHHFGSGSLRGARTLLPRKFIVNPIMFIKELNELLGKTEMREIFIDPRCVVTTFYDMLLNRYSLKKRNAKDSCGIGINETIERSQYDQLHLNVRQLKEFSTNQLIEKVKQIENEWIPYRLNELDYDPNDFRVFGTKFMTNDIETRFVEYAKWTIDHSIVWNDADLVDKYLAKEEGRKLVFEGAQGMLLDQRRKEYHPYLTRSNTGIKNVCYILNDVKTEVDLEVFLTTRSYLTRHGDGPLFNPTSKAYEVSKDESNPENEFQGNMRFGFLDYTWYTKAIAETEVALQKKDIDGTVSVAMTCLDQVMGAYEERDTEVFVGPENRQVFEKVGNFLNIKLLSHGKTEKDIEVIE